MLVPLLSTLVLAASAAAQSTTFSIALGSGPEAPALTTTAATGSWRPPQPTGGLPPASLSGMGRQMYINSANDFCLLMPPDPTTQNLVEAEALAVSYCITPGNDTRPMPDDFLRAALVRRSQHYISVIGIYKPAVMNLAINDAGGEYDNHGAAGVGNPVGTSWKDPEIRDFHQFLGANDVPDLQQQGYGIFCLRACRGDQSYAYCDNKYDLQGCLLTNAGPYETLEGFTDCDVTDNDPVGQYTESGTVKTFRQGDATTPLPNLFTAPSSSNCKTSSSPAPSGVTYTWNQAAAAQQTAAPSNTRSSGGAGSSSQTTSRAPAGGNGASGASSTWAAPGALLAACIAGAAIIGALAL